MEAVMSDKNRRRGHDPRIAYFPEIRNVQLTLKKPSRRNRLWIWVVWVVLALMTMPAKPVLQTNDMWA